MEPSLGEVASELWRDDPHAVLESSFHFDNKGKITSEGHTARAHSDYGDVEMIYEGSDREGKEIGSRRKE